MNFERRSGTVKVSGGTNEQNINFADAAHDIFSKEIRLDDFGEIEKTEEEKIIADAVIEKINQFIVYYGGRPLNIKEHNVHLIDGVADTEKKRLFLDNLYGIAGGSGISGLCGFESVYILKSKIVNNLHLAYCLSHELIHFLSFNSFVISENKPQPHRAGLLVSSRGQIKFRELNEAITEELNIRFRPRLREISQLTGLFDDIETKRKMFSLPELLSYDQINDLGGGYMELKGVISLPYKEFRDKLNKIIDLIYEKRKDQFSNREDVFKVFAKASMTGELKELTLLVEETLGRGTFKKLAQNFREYELV